MAIAIDLDSEIIWMNFKCAIKLYLRPHFFLVCNINCNSIMQLICFCIFFAIHPCKCTLPFPHCKCNSSIYVNAFCDPSAMSPCNLPQQVHFTARLWNSVLQLFWNCILSREFGMFFSHKFSAICICGCALQIYAITFGNVLFHRFTPSNARNNSFAVAIQLLE